MTLNNRKPITDLRLDDLIVDGDLTVKGQTTRVDEILTDRIEVEDDTGTVQFDIHGDSSPPVLDWKGNNVQDAGIIAADTIKNVASDTELAIGSGAGNGQDNEVAVGADAAQQNTGNNITSTGNDAARNNEGDNTTATGVNAARNNTASDTTATGVAAARDNTGKNTTATGFNAAQNNTSSNTTAAGAFAARNNTGNNTTATGVNAARDNTGNNTTAAGAFAARNNTGNSTTATGALAARGDGLADPTTMGDDNIGIGVSAIRNNQASGLIAIGQEAGINAQTDDQLIITDRNGNRRMVMDLTNGDLKIDGSLTENATL